LQGPESRQAEGSKIKVKKNYFLFLLSAFSFALSAKIPRRHIFTDISAAWLLKYGQK
jgi:hypothetical protein